MDVLLLFKGFFDGLLFSKQEDAEKEVVSSASLMTAFNFLGKCLKSETGREGEKKGGGTESMAFNFL